MDEEERLRHRLNQEIASFSINNLTQLGNQAISLGLIVGHGYHGGKYEILRQGQVLLMSPEKAQAYLENLIKGIVD